MQKTKLLLVAFTVFFSTVQVWAMEDVSDFDSDFDEFELLSFTEEDLEKPLTLKEISNSLSCKTKNKLLAKEIAQDDQRWLKKIFVAGAGHCFLRNKKKKELHPRFLKKEHYPWVTEGGTFFENILVLKNKNLTIEVYKSENKFKKRNLDLKPMKKNTLSSLLYGGALGYVKKELNRNPNEDSQYAIAARREKKDRKWEKWTFEPKNLTINQALLVFEVEENFLKTKKPEDLTAYNKGIETFETLSEKTKKLWLSYGVIVDPEK